MNITGVLMQDLINKFIDAMHEAGSSPADSKDIVADGADHYIDGAGDKKKGRIGYSLKICPDGFAFGNFRNFRTGDHGKWNSATSGLNVSSEEKEKYKKRIRSEEIKLQGEREKAYKQVAQEALNKWELSGDAKPDHPYLIKKNIKPYGLKQEFDALLVPVYIDFELYGLQSIYPDGSKYHLKGAKKQGGWYEIKGNAEKVLICEGVATGHTLHEATGYKVYVCFDAGNIPECIEKIASLNQESIIIVCADNDNLSKNQKGQPFNAGVHYGTKAAAKVGGFCIYPDEDDSDFNDVGLDKAREKVEGVKRIEVELPPSEAYEDEYRATPFQVIEYDEKSPIWDEDRIRASMQWRKLPTAKDPLGEPDSGISNIMLYLRHFELFAHIFRYDEFQGQVIVHKCPFWQRNPDRFKVRRVHDTDLTYISEWLEKRRIKANAERINDAINVIARENRMHPPRDYFDNLKWDGIKRLDTWLTYYLGADTQSQEYLAKIGSCWLIAGVARIYQPGCKVDTMLVLEGEQGAMKSTALEVLANVGDKELEESYFCDTLNFGKIHDKDALMMLQGKLIVEFAELSKLGEREIEEVKQWMTNKVDECRRPYGKLVEQFPRQFILAGSTNNSVYLRDKTGNRRFWPVKCGSKFDTKALKADREQIWAEAVARYKEGDIWWIDRDDQLWEIVKGEQSLRLLEDAWDANVTQAIEGKEVVTLAYVMGELGLDMAQRGASTSARIAGILSSLGWVNKVKYSSQHQKTVRGWWRT
jgi:putative DNA primase/helicase